jgi:Flp pilus assembly protein TadD
MKENKNKLFYRLTPILTIIFALIIATAAYWEWRAAPKSNAQGLEAFNNENYSEAIRKFSQAQQQCETDIMARYYLGAAYHNYKWNDEALQEYDITWNLTREYGVRAMHGAGRIWFQKMKYRKAIQCFDRALRLNQTLPEVWFDLAQVHLAMKNMKSAEYCVSQAVKYDPKNKEYQQLLLKLALGRKKY